MHSVLNSITRAQRCVAILIDPEKTGTHQFTDLLTQIALFTAKAQHELHVTTFLLFVGGSTMEAVNLDHWIRTLKRHTTLPVVIFPGSHNQLSEHAAGLLFLNLLSGRNANYLVEQQVQAAALLQETRLEIIPTAYLLINGDTISAVQRVSNTIPIAQNEVETIKNTAYAGELMGNKLVYLEAGSGAKTPVNKAIIKAVSNLVKVPILVGGGIRTFAGMEQAFTAGARVVVVGTAFENGDL